MRKNVNIGRSLGHIDIPEGQLIPPRELESFRDAGVRHFQVRFMDYPSPAGLERFVGKVLPRLTA